VKRFWLAVGAVLGAVALLAFFVGPHLDALPPVCAFRALTGRPCVFCGMSHAVAYAIRGDLASASTAHPAWFVVLPLFASFVGAMVTRRARLAWAIVAALLVGTLIRSV